VATLTPEGQRAFLRARRTHLAGVSREFLERFDEEELAAMAAFWERVLPGSTT
jgi:DNA-binding MarR family transcriptional regulator